jgi:hypothetical protein
MLNGDVPPPKAIKCPNKERFSGGRVSKKSENRGSLFILIKGKFDFTIHPHRVGFPPL